MNYGTMDYHRIRNRRFEAAGLIIHKENHKYLLKKIQDQFRANSDSKNTLKNV